MKIAGWQNIDTGTIHPRDIYAVSVSQMQVTEFCAVQMRLRDKHMPGDQ